MLFMNAGINLYANMLPLSGFVFATAAYNCLELNQY